MTIQIQTFGRLGTGFVVGKGRNRKILLTNGKWKKIGGSNEIANVPTVSGNRTPALLLTRTKARNRLAKIIERYA